jgi:hypothetical protein
MLSPSRIRAVLGKCCRGERDRVCLVQPLDAAGLSMAYADFVAHFDSFWVPWTDNLLVIEVELAWFIEMSHDEILTYTEISEPLKRVRGP